MHGRLARLAVAIVTVGSIVLTAPSSASACVGGGLATFRHAIADTTGGVLEARIISVFDTMGRGIEVELADVRRIAGRPDLVTTSSLTAGAACEQSLDVGETVWLLYDLHGWEIPQGLTVAFVMDGSDAVSAADRRWAHGVLPDTSTVAATSGQTAPAWLLVLWVASFAVALWRQTGAQPVVE